MDIQAYISSGILETYVMGLASPEEAQEVETLAAKFPAIRIELGKIENALSDYALLNSKTPPPELRDKIFSTITAQENNSSLKNGSKLIDFKDTRSSGAALRMKWYAVAASVALLISFAYNYSLLKQQEKEKAIALTTIDSLSETNSHVLQQLTFEKEAAARNLALLTQPGNHLIEMKGLDISPSSLAWVLYNPQTSQAYLNVKSLPLPPEDKQYQLWAIVDGKPVDLGVFDVQTEITDLLKMKSIDNPQAFAVTLEPRGGSASPTLEQMYVMGKNG